MTTKNATNGKGDRTRATQERRGDYQSQRDGQQGVRHRIGPGQDAGGLGGRKTQHRGVQRNRSASAVERNMLVDGFS